MFNYDTSPTLINVTFSGNTADQDGGGMYNDDSSSPTLTNVTFSGNSAAGRRRRVQILQLADADQRRLQREHAAQRRRHIQPLRFADADQRHIQRQLRQRQGGGMYNNSSSPTLTNVTFSGNSARPSAAGWTTPPVRRR